MTKRLNNVVPFRKAAGKGSQAAPLSEDRLADLIEEATVDAYGPSEQVSGFFTMLEEHLAFPFSAKVLGVDVVVDGVDLTDADEIVAVCKHGRVRQAIPILELPLPTPPPEGAEWIAAYRHWRGAE